VACSITSLARRLMPGSAACASRQDHACWRRAVSPHLLIWYNDFLHDQFLRIRRCGRIDLIDRRQILPRDRHRLIALDSKWPPKLLCIIPAYSRRTSESHGMSLLFLTSRSLRRPPERRPVCNILGEMVAPTASTIVCQTIAHPHKLPGPYVPSPMSQTGNAHFSFLVRSIPLRRRPVGSTTKFLNLDPAGSDRIASGFPRWPPRL